MLYFAKTTQIGYYILDASNIPLNNSFLKVHPVTDLCIYIHTCVHVHVRHGGRKKIMQRPNPSLQSHEHAPKLMFCLIRVKKVHCFSQDTSIV